MKEVKRVKMKKMKKRKEKTARGGGAGGSLYSNGLAFTRPPRFPKRTVLPKGVGLFKCSKRFKRVRTGVCICVGF